MLFLEEVQTSQGMILLLQETPSYYAQVANLFRKVFYRNYTSDYFKWKYRESFREQIFAIGAVETATNTLVGHVAAVPLRGKLYDKDCTFFQFVDAMVDPHWRGHNLLTRMIHLLVKLIKATTQNSFCYVFPGPISLEIGKKYKWLYPVDAVQDISFRAPSVLPRLTKPVIQFEENRLTVDTHEKLFRQILIDYPCCIQRDWTFFKWRFFEHPANKYNYYLVKLMGKPIGWSVFMKVQHELRLIDYWIFKKFLPLFFTALCNYNGVTVWIPKHIRIAIKHLRPRYKDTPITACLIGDEKIWANPTSIRDDLFYTMADIDIY